MAEESPQRRQHTEVGSAEPGREPHRDRSLERIANERCRRKAFAACAQHVRCTDVARPDSADVLRSREPREHKPERDRAEQITEQERARVIGKGK